MNKYIIMEGDISRYDAGSKAPADIYNILVKKEYIPIFLKLSRNNNIFLKYLKYLIIGTRDVFSILRNVKNESWVVIQVPFDMPDYIMHYYLWILKKIKKCKIISFVHDIMHLRYDGKKENGEKKIYELIDVLVVHNLKMKEYLLEKGFMHKRIEIIEIFDYITSEQVHSRKYSGIANAAIVIAGNLKKEKAGYVYKLKNIKGKYLFNLYGPGYKGEDNEQVHYKGTYKPDELPKVLEGEFGLIWDGNSIETCSGSYGRYMKINNPHKLSLYLAAGLPVITWSQAAIADFVEKNKVGIVIDSLYQLEEALNKIKENEFNEMLTNVSIVGERLRQGYYTEKVINIIENT